MAVYKNITSEGITTLIARENKRTGTGPKSTIDKILISNNSSSNATIISLQLWDGTSVGYNIIGNVTMPAGTALVLEDNLSFDKNRYNLRMETTGVPGGTAPVIDVIII